MRKLQTRWSGLEFGKMRGWRRSAGVFLGADGGLQWLWRARWRDRTRQEALADWAGASLRGRWVGWRVSGRGVPSGREWNGSQQGQGAAELLSPRPAIWKMQGQPACRAGEPSGQGEDPSSEGLGGHDLLTQADPRRPAGQVMRHHLNREPGSVGGEAPRGEMVQPDAVLEVAYRILDLGVAAMVSFQFEQLPVPVGDEAVIAVGGEEGQLGTGRRLHPPDDEPHRRGVRLGLEGGVGGFGHIGGAVHPVRNRRPGIFGFRLDEIPQAFVLADGDGEADIHPAADGDHGVGIEAAVSPHCELPPSPAVAHPPHRLTQEVGGAAGGVGQALAQASHQHVAGAGGDGQQRVIAPRTGVAVVTGALLGQSVGLADRRIKVDGEWCVAGSGTGLPDPGQQLAAHAVELTDVPPAKAAQEGPESLPSRRRGVDGALTTQPRTRAVPPARSASASSMQSPPASAEATSVSSLSPAFARPGASPRSR